MKICCCWMTSELTTSFGTEESKKIVWDFRIMVLMDKENTHLCLRFSRLKPPKRDILHWEWTFLISVAFNDTKLSFSRIDFICLPDPICETTEIERHGVVQSSVVLASVVSTSVSICPKDQCIIDNNKMRFADEEEQANPRDTKKIRKPFGKKRNFQHEQKKNWTELMEFAKLSSDRGKKKEHGKKNNHKRK